MGESSNSSSSKLPHSGSSRHQQQQPQHPEENRTDSKANTNIVKVTPPSVVIMEDEKEHPLLYGNILQPPKHPKPTLQKRSSPTMNMNEKGKADTAHAKKKNTPMSTVLFAVPMIISLLILGRPHVNSVISNTNGMLSDLCTTLSAAYLLVISLVRGLSRDKILSLIPSFHTRKVALPIRQLEQRLELGFDLLRKYDDASGSSAICESVVHFILRSHGELQDENWKGSASSMTSLFSVDENKLLSKAYRCVGEAKLSLYSSSITSTSFKSELLTNAKESFESAVS